MREMLGLFVVAAVAWGQAPAVRQTYKLLATAKTSTMEKEMNEAADAGYSYRGVMGGESAFGGKETVVVMGRASDAKGKKRYKLLCTARTSTMQKEISAAGDEGFLYMGQTVFESAFGGKEVCVIVERDAASGGQRWDYKILATAKTSTMEKELKEAGEQGFNFVGVSVGKTAFGGNEVVSFLIRPKP